MKIINKIIKIVLYNSLAFLLFTSLVMAQSQTLYLPSTAEYGVTFSAPASGNYRFTIIGGAWSPVPEESPENMNWLAWAVIYKNRNVQFEPDPNRPGLWVPVVSDFVVGDQTYYPTYAMAEAAGKGLFVDIPLNKGDYLVFLPPDHRDWYYDNRGGIYFNITPPPTVKIDGNIASVIFYPIDRSPPTKLIAIASPAGGSYKWEIVMGQDKVKLSDINSRVVSVQSIAPSENPIDVQIKVTYSIGSQIAEAYHSMTVRKPSSLSVLESYPITDPPKKDIFGNVVEYSTLYKFQIRDQFDRPLNVKMEAWEKRSFFSVYPPDYSVPDITLYKKRTTNKYGAFPDELYLRDHWPSIPGDLVLKYQQYNYVEGWFVGLRCQTFYYDHGTSEEGPCK